MSNKNNAKNQKRAATPKTPNKAKSNKGAGAKFNEPIRFTAVTEAEMRRNLIK